MTDLYILVSGKVCARASDQGGSPRIIYEMGSEGVRAGFPISLSMPIRREGYGGGVVRNWLENLLPENRDDLAAIARDQTGGFAVCSPENPLRMLEKIGEDCAGAVQVVQEDRIDSVVDNGGIVRISDTEIETMIRDVRQGRAIAGRSPSRLQGRFSLAGAQRKTALRRLSDGSWGIPYGNEPTTHIMKPPIPNMAGQVEAEHFCLQLAQQTGLAAAESEVMEFGEEKVICVTRFDRRPIPGGGIARRHIEDMCQALGRPSFKKYQKDGGPGVTDICGKVLSRSVHPDDDRRTFMNALVLNWVLMGTDAHAKNYSVFIVPPNETAPDIPRSWLAPLYDLNTFAVYPEASWTSNEMSMSIAQKYTFSHVHEKHWHQACERAGIFPNDRGVWLEEMICSIREMAPLVAQHTIEEGLDPDWMRKIAEVTTERCEIILSDLFPGKTFTFSSTAPDITPETPPHPSAT